MKKRYQNIIRVSAFVLVYFIISTNVIFASQPKSRKGGYNKLPSQGPVVSESKKNVIGIRQKVDPITTNDIILKNQLNNAEVFDTVTFGRYEQDNNLDNGYEPIEWIVLCKTEDGKALLTSKYILDCRKFNTYPGNITWERSTLRSWLNHNFYSEAFNVDESKLVLETTIQNKKNYFYNTDCGNPTLDRVFCLSIEEAIMYFEDGDDYYTKQQNCLLPNDKRKCQATPYAIKMGVRVSNRTGQSYGCGNYWLRTMGKNEEREWYSGIFAKYYAAIVQEPGYIKPMGTAIHSSDDGVRPCIWVKTS